MFNFSANHLFLLSRTEYPSCAVFLLRGIDTPANCGPLLKDTYLLERIGVTAEKVESRLPFLYAFSIMQSRHAVHL